MKMKHCNVSSEKIFFVNPFRFLPLSLFFLMEELKQAVVRVANLVCHDFDVCRRKRNLLMPNFPS